MMPMSYIVDARMSGFRRKWNASIDNLREIDNYQAWLDQLLSALGLDNQPGENVAYQHPVVMQSNDGMTTTTCYADAYVKGSSGWDVLIENKAPDVNLDARERRDMFGLERWVSPFEQVHAYAVNEGRNDRTVRIRGLITTNCHEIRYYDYPHLPKQRNLDESRINPDFVFCMDEDTFRNARSRFPESNVLMVDDEHAAYVLRLVLSGFEVPDEELTSKAAAEAMNEIRYEIAKDEQGVNKTAEPDLTKYDSFINNLALVFFLGRSYRFDDGNHVVKDKLRLHLDSMLTAVGNHILSAKAMFKALFTWLGADDGKRRELLSDDITAPIYEQLADAGFPYVGGSAFADDIPVPNIGRSLLETIISCYDKYEWDGIDSALFGSMMVITQDEIETRRKGTGTSQKVSVKFTSGVFRHQFGIHWTSKAFIHRVIDPIVIDRLQELVNNAINMQSESYSDVRDADGNVGFADHVRILQEAHLRLAAVRMLDPACGSGNFITESYSVIRHLENMILKELHGLGCMITTADILVSPDSYAGIELIDNTTRIARSAMQIARVNALADFTRMTGIKASNLFPFTDSDACIARRIITGNSLAEDLDWNDVIKAHDDNVRICNMVDNNGNISFSYELVPADDADNRGNVVNHIGGMTITRLCERHNDDIIIVGNPPFVGKSGRGKMNESQKNDMKRIMGAGYDGYVDYSMGFDYKAADYINNAHDASFAFIQTSAVVKGSQAMLDFKPLFDKGLSMSFAYTPFVWSAHSDEAQVDVIITCWKRIDDGENARIYDGNDDGNAHIICKHINNYLEPLDNIWIRKTSEPMSSSLRKVREGVIFSDNGALQITDGEHPDANAMKYVRKFITAKDMIRERPANQSKRVLWLDGIQESDRSNPCIQSHVDKVKASRGKNVKASPYLAKGYGAQPNRTYMAVPITYSISYPYIPADMFDASTITNNTNMTCDASGLLFSVMCSSANMTWNGLVGGKMRTSGYQFRAINWNSLPFPDLLTDRMKASLDNSGKRLLVARCDNPVDVLQEAADMRASDGIAVNIREHLDADGLPDDTAWSVLDGFDIDGMLSLTAGRRSRSLMELYGSTADMKPVLRAAHEHNDALVDECIIDNAFGVGSYDGKLAGTFVKPDGSPDRDRTITDDFRLSALLTAYGRMTADGYEPAVIG